MGTDSSPPRLLFVSTIDLPDQGDTTERKKWTRMAEAFDVHVICFGREGFGAYRRFGCTFVTIPGSGPLPLRLLVYYLLVPWITAYLALFEGVRTWIAQSPYEAGAVCLVKLPLSLTGCRLIIEAHGDWIRSFLELRFPPFPGAVTKLLEFYSSMVLWTANAYRSISEETSTLLRNHGDPDRPHVQFPTYMDVETFLDCTLEEKRRREQPTFLYAGALTELKGLGFLLEVFREVHRDRDDLELRLCGKGPDEAQFRGRCREFGIDDAVSFQGHLPTEQLKERMLEARLVLLPSRTEGFGRVLVEGLATYTPFVATPGGGPIEIAERSKGGRIVEADQTSWSEQLIDLLDDQETRRRMGRAGRSFVEKNYSTESYVDQYRKLVEQARET